MTELVKKQLKQCSVFIWGFVALIASAGAMNTGEGFYITFGVLNLLVTGFAIYRCTKLITEHEEK